LYKSSLLEKEAIQYYRFFFFLHLELIYNPEKASGAKLNKLSPKDINNMSLDELRKSIPDDWKILKTMDEFI
jgi:hypothetical protein